MLPENTWPASGRLCPCSAYGVACWLLHPAAGESDGVCSIMLNILGEADGEEGASQADAIMEHAQEVCLSVFSLRLGCSCGPLLCPEGAVLHRL